VPTTSDRVVDLLKDLVAINSVNPAYPEGNGEAAVANYVERHCRELGLDVVRQPVLPDRDNIVASITVPGANRTLLYESHMDTVGLDPMGEAGLVPVVRDGKLYGRGACDTKGSLAAMLVAFERLLEHRADLSVNVALLASVDEEYAYRGVLTYIESQFPATAAIVGEPTDLRVVVAHKGCVRGSIIVSGRAAHSSEPEHGISAIDGMADVVVALRGLQGRLATRHHDLVGSPTFSIGVIEGGTGVNIVPERCTITYDRRTLPDEDPDSVLAELDDVLGSVQAARPELTIERQPPRLFSEGLETPVDSALVRAAIATCRESNLIPDPAGVPYGSDASKLQKRRGIPSLVFGPGSIAQAHGADEYVPLDHLDAATEVYAGIALHFPGE
jgi:acetylornithine deacetylase/succinyl-diaminopimelate desuccinylase family protein